MQMMRTAALVLACVGLAVTCFFVFVITDRVPGGAKDGLFGLAGGLVVAVFLSNVFSATVSLGKYSGQK
jgi:hypothetical protein